jgi:hypothetical protein
MTPECSGESSNPARRCCWLRERWVELRAQLKPATFWQLHDRLKAVRLLGRQPVDAVEDRRVAEIYVASHAINPVGESEFDDLLSDMETSQLVRFRETVWARWPDLVRATQTAQCRQILMDLVDRNIERLNARLEVHEENANADAERTVAASDSIKLPTASASASTR